MQLTPQQKKALIIVAAVFFGSYVFRYTILGALGIQAYMRHAVLQAQRRNTPKAAPVKKLVLPPSAPVETVSTPVDTKLNLPEPEPLPVPPPPVNPRPGLTTEMQQQLLGVWQGRTAVMGRGYCDMRFEFRLKDQTPEDLKGSVSITCTPAPGLTAGKTVDKRAQMVDRTNPEAAVLAGDVKDENTFAFHDAQVLSNDSTGCKPTAVTLTRFGVAGLAAKWEEEDPCHGGSVMLRRYQ